RESGRAAAIERVNLDGKRVEQMRQRQPYGADLLPSRRKAVEHPPRDHQMRPRVVVGKHEAGAPVVHGADGADRQREETTNHGGASWGHGLRRQLVYYLTG